MKYLILLFVPFFVMKGNAQENYSLKIGDKDFNVALDSSYEITVGGKKINLLLKQRDTLMYSDTMFSFSYFKGYQVSKTTIDNIANQYIVIDAGGSGFMLQKYWTMNPTMLREILMQEVTKESKGYGYLEKREEYQRTLASGQEVTVLKSTLTYKDEINIFEVTALGGKDEGLVIMTMDMGGDVAQRGRDLSSLMWKSIRYNSKSNKDRNDKEQVNARREKKER